LVLKAALRIPRAINALVQAMEGNVLGSCQLILIFEGSLTAVRQDGQRASELAERGGGQSLGDQPAKAWEKHRYSVSYRQSPIFRMGAFSDTMEVAAPWARLGEVYRNVRRALGKHVVVLAHLSHAYPDGSSIYFTFSARARNDAQALLLYDRVWKEALQAAIEAGATLSHHHGVGRSKAPLLGAELGYGVEMVRNLMRAWDPSGIMNPGALVMTTQPGPPPPRREGGCHVDARSMLADFDPAPFAG
jgi:alkyldihydroxyacetonephosphate synthase